MKRPVLTLALLTACLQAHAQTLTLKATTDRPDAIYKAGETATFTIEASQSAEVTCIFSKDGLNPQPAKKLTLQDGKLALTGTLDEPGFLQLRVTSGKVTAIASAAFDPLQIKPSMPVPDDFDAFWDAQKAALAEVPLKSKLTPVQTAAKGVDALRQQTLERATLLNPILRVRSTLAIGGRQRR